LMADTGMSYTGASSRTNILLDKPSITTSEVLDSRGRTQELSGGPAVAPQPSEWKVIGKLHGKLHEQVCAVDNPSELQSVTVGLRH
jgi:hypothetical protein